MINLFNPLRKKYQTLSRIEISKRNLLDNYKYLLSITKKIRIAPVLKSNAYGHGIAEVAKILDPLNAPFFCVDSLYEAYELLKAKIKTPVLIMGYTNPENFKVKRLPFSYALFDLETATVLNKYQAGCKVHIFVDTGMHREGVPLDELTDFLNKLKELTNLKVEGLMSHLASADNLYDHLNKTQIKNFKKVLEICRKNGIKPEYIHIANSDGLINFRKNLGFTNLARVGLALYLKKPVLSLKTKIIQIKKLKKGESIGYSGTFTARKYMKIGILPLGYFDGVDRRLSSAGWVSVDGKLCKIIGKVSMNITTVDLTNIPNPYIGQEAIVYSNNPEDKNSIENVAKICKTIPYDILVNLVSSTRRIIL